MAEGGPAVFGNCPFRGPDCRQWRRDLVSSRAVAAHGRSVITAGRCSGESFGQARPIRVVMLATVLLTLVWARFIRSWV